MGYRFDMHVHTAYSPDSSMTPPQVVRTALKKGLAGIAVTDHETIEGALAVRDYIKANRIPLKIIIGQEKKTDGGELLALFIERPINSRKLGEAMAEVRVQGGLLVIPHPFRNRQQIRGLADEFDFIEVHNSRTFCEQNRLAKGFAKGHKEIVGSDAHFPREVGRAVVVFKSVENIKKQLIAGDYSFEIAQRSDLDLFLGRCQSVFVKEGLLYLMKRLLKRMV